MTGLYSPINKLMEQVTRPKGTGAEYMAELQKKPGYKPAEAEDRDLQALMALPQMERAAFMEKLKAQANKYPLKMRELEDDQTHHENYTLPGGENYREILLHTPMPKGEGYPGVDYHFGGMPNILASIRVKDRITPGPKMYAVQSQQPGFLEGGKQYKTAEEARAAMESFPESIRPSLFLTSFPGPNKKTLHIEEIQSDWHQEGREKGYLNPNEEHTPEEKKYGIPYGPHAKDWHELALKAMIQHAAEKGYHQIAITPGAEQADRYGLSEHVGSVSYNPETQHFQAFKPNRETITNEKGASPERIKALIGKEAAAKLLQAPQQMGHHYLEGEDLNIGGEGMKGFYDKMVPTFLNKFGKKHGVQVQQGQVATDKTMSRGPQGNAMVPSYEQNYAPVHTFDITPGMREDVLKNGIPRYAEGGDVNDADRMTPRSRGRASFGATPRGNRIIKETGGNWIGGSIEEALKPLRQRTSNTNDRDPAETLQEFDQVWTPEAIAQYAQKNPAHTLNANRTALQHKAAVNQWIDRNLANYVKKQMATKEDPVRKLAEQGITHLPQDAINRGQWESDHLGQIRRSEGFPESGLATNEPSRGWENLADEAIQITAPIVANKEMLEANPWLSKLPPTQSVYRARKADISELGFDHIVDVLKQDVAAGRIRPEQLNKISMEQAVRRAYEHDQEQAKKMRETAVKATEGMPVHKEYDTGHKWIELAAPDVNKFEESIRHLQSNPKEWQKAIEDFRENRQKNLESALKYEGDTMGHCVGGYTPDVLSGHSRIYSLRDAKGEPHVTIETQPMRGSELGRYAADLPDGEDAIAMKNPPQRIVQIKGKQNRAPDKKYLPMVQDFVKSGKWSDVGDAKNAGLRKYGDVFSVNEQRQIEKTGEQVPEHEWLAGEDIQRLHNAITPPGKRLKYDANGNIVGTEGGYATGGSVSRGTIKEKVTISPNMDVMQYELINKKVK